jgi:S1-C subfamily serine protease
VSGHGQPSTPRSTWYDEDAYPARPGWEAGSPMDPWATPPPTGPVAFPPTAYPPRPRNHPLRAVVIAALVVVLSIVAGTSIVRGFVHVTSGLVAGADPFPGLPNAPRPGAPLDTAAITAAVNPTIVDVNTTLGLQGTRAAGTGIVLTAIGVVLTNNHVIAGATSISAVNKGDGRTYPASVLGYDRSHDIAVIKLKGASRLRTAAIGDSSKVGVGDSIMAVGNAGGVGGTPTAVTGAVTALDQTITASDENGANAERLTGLIRVAANIQPGDSGGPLVDSGGRVIGVNTAATVDFQFQASGNEGFAIPINQALAIGNEIQAGRGSSTVHIGETAFLGVSVAASGGQAEAGGAEVAGVVPNSPAAQVGMRPGDVIVSIDGRPVDSPTALTNLLIPHHPGDQVAVAWQDRTGQSRTARLRLTTGPAG